MTSRSQFTRRTAGTVAGLALALTAAGALPAGATTAGTGTDGTGTDGTRVTGSAGAVATSVAAQPTISISASKTTVKAWSEVVLKGSTSGVASGATVTVQRLQGTKWVTFPASTKVTSKHAYSVRVQSGRVGVNTFRVVAGKAVSKSVKVTVTK